MDKFLYHGSQYKLDIIKPQKASGMIDNESLFAIYAAKYIKEVIPFALPIRWYPDNPNGKRAFICNHGYTHIEYGSINPNGVGYVYKLPANSFVQLDDWQWISTIEVKPIEILEINVIDYWNMITFSVEALDIEKRLYEIRDDRVIIK